MLLNRRKYSAIFPTLLLSLLLTTAAYADPSRFCVELLTQAEMKALPEEVRAQIVERTQLLRRSGRPYITTAEGRHIDILESMNRELARPVLDMSKRAAMGRANEIADAWMKQLRADATATKTKFADATKVEVEAIKKKYSALLKAESDRIMDAVEADLVARREKAQIDWNAILIMARPRLAEMIAELEAKFGRKSPVVVELAQDAAVARVNERGVPELNLPELGIRARYDVELGTMVIENQKGPTAEKGPLLITDHGDGTAKSVAASWKFVLAKFFSSAFNAMAMNLPKAGIGMDFLGLHKTVMYLDQRFRAIAERHAEQGAGARRPLVQLGRSMGSTKGFAHAFFFEGAENPVDAYVFSSFSNPETFDLQERNIHDQVARGIVTNLVPESLANAGVISRELLAALEKVRRKDPKAYELVGDKQLFLQGNADEDGGPTVIADLLSFQKKYTPLSHVYVFENALLKHEVKGRENMDPEKWEATHTLFSNLPNVTKEQGAKTYPGVPEKDLPALQDQYFEAVGAMHGFFDYLAENNAPTMEMKRSKQVFSNFRNELTGGKSFVEWYAEKSKLSMSEVRAATAGRESRAARLKKVMDFWAAEKVRVEAVYKAAGAKP